MKRLILITLCFLVMLCGCSAPMPKTDGKISVVTTIFPVYDFARAVGGDNIDLTLLIKPGTEVHTYDPLPSDMQSVYNCDLFLYVGGESESWVQSLLSESSINSLALIDEVEHKHHGHDGHHHTDEHIWTSPANAVLMVEKICEMLSECDVQNADKYRKNTDEYKQKITVAADDIGAVVKKVQNPFILVADRFPFGYFAEEYGIDYEAAFDACAASTDISINTMSRLTQTIENRGIKAVFCTELSTRNIADALSEQTGVKVLELHSGHNVTLDDFESGTTYVDILYRNQTALKEGLFSGAYNG